MNLRWRIAQFFEKWWWRHYLRNKSEEDYLAWKRAYWQRFLNDTGTWPGPQERLLDAGCGPAGIFIMFPEHAVTAVDPLLGKYRNQMAFLQDGRSGKVQLVTSALEHFSDELPFDRIFCLNAINHVADPDVCLQNLRKLTAGNGRLILTVDAHNHPLLKKIFRLLPGDILHPHQLSLEDYTDKLVKCGFRIGHTKLLTRDFIFSYHLIVAVAAGSESSP